MERRFLKYGILVFALLTFTQVWGQKVTFKAKYGVNRIAQNRKLKVEFVLENAKADEFEGPDFEKVGLKKLSGPNHGSFSQTVFDGRQMTRLESTTYSYILSPKKVGKITVGAAKVKVKGKVYKTKPFTIEVVKGEMPEVVKKRELYGKTFVSKTSMYVGEPVVVTRKLYSKYPILRVTQNNVPDVDLGWVSKIEVTGKGRREKVGGVEYTVYDIEKFVLYPNKTGKFEIPAYSMELIYGKSTGRRNIWGEPAYSQYEVFFQSNSARINVLPLPEPAPADFQGAVGKLDLSATISKQKVNPDEPITLSIKIHGSGNLKFLEDLKPVFPPDFEVYDPKITDKIKENAGGAKGYRKYDFVLVPRYSGSYILPEIKFVYFDPSKKKYRTLRTPEFSVEVGPGREKDVTDRNTDAAEKESVQAESVQQLATDIRYLKTDIGSLQSKGSRFFHTTTFYILFLAGLVSGVMLSIASGKQKKSTDVISARMKKAQANARKVLKGAKKSLDNNEKGKFFEQVYEATSNYLADRFQIDRADMISNHIREGLLSKGVKEADVAELLEIRETCELEKFTPVDVQPKDLYERTEKVIINIEEQVV